MKCLFSWIPHPTLKTFFEQEVPDHFQLEFVDKEDESALKASIKTADVLVGWQLKPTVLKEAEQLKFILYPGAGVQQISKELIDLFHQKEIIFTNSHSNSFATAQHGVALLLSLTNQLFLHHRLLKSGQWRTGDKEGKSVSLRNKKVGLLGFGAIGKCIYEMLKGFQVDFLFYKQSQRKDSNYKGEYFSAEENQLSPFLQQADVLICSLPHTSQTENLLCDHEFDLMKNEALFINIGRGKVVNEKALYEALSQSKIAAAAIDVWYEYQPKSNDKGQKFPFVQPFTDLDNLILSPHRAASPMDDPFRFKDILENLKRISLGYQDLINVIDFEQEY